MPTPSVVPQPPGPSPTPSPAPVRPVLDDLYSRVDAWRTLTVNAFSETVLGLDTPLTGNDLVAFQDGLMALFTYTEE